MAINPSYVCALDSFDLWGLPPVQDTIEDTTVTEHRPISQLQADTPLEFQLNTAADEYILFKDSYLYFRIKVHLDKQTGVVGLGDWAKVSTVNNLLHSMIKHVEVDINNNTITMAPQTYAHKAYIETLLGYDDSAKKSHLTAALWYKDTTMEGINEARQAFIKGANVQNPRDGSPVELMGRLNLDLCFQSRAFIGGANIKITITLHKNSFFLMINETGLSATVSLENAIFYARRARVNPQIVMAHQKALAVQPAKYPLTRGEVKTNLIHKGTVDTILENVVTGKMPRRIFICFVDNEALNGSYKKNPFNFQLFDLSFLCCYVNGHAVPAIPYQPKDGNTLREYHGLMDALDQTGTSNYCEINRHSFNNGYAIFGINMAPDLSDGCGATGHVNRIKTGAIRIQVIFGKPLDQPVTCLTYCEFDSVLQMDIDRNPIVDF